MQVQVLDQNNEPITGAKVTVLQSSSALYTNFDGVAQLDVNQPVKEIKVEMMGYAPKIVQLGAQKELNVIRVVLTPDQK